MEVDEDGTQHQTYQGYYVRTPDNNIVGSIRELPDERFSLTTDDIRAAANVLAEEISNWAHRNRIGELPAALPFDLEPDRAGFARVDIEPEHGVAVSYKP